MVESRCKKWWLAGIVLGCIIVGITPRSQSNGTFTLEGDARGRWFEGQHPEASLEVAAISIRKTLADTRGDRWQVSGLIEIHDDLSEISIHDAYLRYKGPMGRWNITAGRFQLPFSLLSSFSTSRFLYDNLTGTTLGLHSDGGMMLSGIIGDMDYGISATQGLGVHDDPAVDSLDLFSGRIGWTFGDMGEITAGISFLTGETHDIHSNLPNHTSDQHSNVTTERTIIGVDGSVLEGLWMTRWEIQTGTIDHEPFAGGFVMADYGILPGMDLTGAINLRRYSDDLHGNIYLGLGYRTPWFVMRGGYNYEISETDDSHGISIQLYRVMSWPF